MDYEILIRFFLAALWGGLVGSEREYHSKSAGFRTMIMISLGSCFFTMMSMMIGHTVSPDRIASNIVTGIGFLGAGVIFRGENRINGITTAATIWAVAAIGMGIGAGYYFASSIASLLILFILGILPYLEKLIDHLNQSRVYKIDCTFTEDSLSNFEQLLKKYHLKSTLQKHIKSGNDLSLTWQVFGRSKNHELFIHEMVKKPEIMKFEY